MRGFAQLLYTLINFSDLRELVNFACATIGTLTGVSVWTCGTLTMIVDLCTGTLSLGQGAQVDDTLGGHGQCVPG